MKLPIIILGGGGHAKVLIDALLLTRKEILGYTDVDGEKKSVLGVSFLGDDEEILKYDPEHLKLVNGVGSVTSTTARMRLFEKFQRKGYHFESVIHPSAIIASDVQLGEGVQIMAAAVVQPGGRLGDNTILNSGVTVDHDCDIGDHVHIAPGAVICGDVRIEEGVHVGTGGVIVQGVVIGAKSLIGAGAVVLEDVPAGVTVAGVPGKVISNRG